MKNLRRSFGFWAAVVIVIGGTLYPLSIAPAIWLGEYKIIPFEVVYTVWGPVNDAYARSPQPVRAAFDWYLSLWGLPADVPAP
ncbi:MAG: hypothetical protein EXS05_23720 [Planctomycetaceae bacterium]|nr:hypothetical protein [Planctomycetaceae bacterium]